MSMKLAYEGNRYVYDTIAAMERRFSMQPQSKMPFILRKAMKSIAQFPLPIASGRQATQLSGIGRGLSDDIDRALSIAPPEVLAKLQRDHALATGVAAQAGAALGALANPAEQQEAVAPKRKAGDDAGGPAKRQKERAYIPRNRSGAFALLVALERAAQAEDYKGWMGREELINAARPHCDSSFEAAVEGSHYCAWSSMGTLIAKGLVIKVSNPARFSLSKDGAAIAMKLIQAPRNAASGSSIEPGGSSSSVPASAPPASVSSFAHRARPFEMLGGDFEEAGFADDADEFYEPMFDEFDGNQVRDQWQAGAAKDARATGVASQPAQAAWQFDDDDLVIIDDPKSSLPAARRVISLPPHPSKVPPPPAAAASFMQSRSNEIHRTLSSSSAGWKPVVQPAMSAASAIIHRTKAPPQLARTLSGSSTQSAAPGVLNQAAAAAAQPVATHVNPAVSAMFKRLRPSDWRVIMLVDNREVAGRADRRHLIEQLHARGVDCEVRTLSLGDVMWIARPRDTVSLQHLPVGSAAYLDATLQNSVEIVLDCIVERKKIPDLACSIIDNRYIDQKIRLKETGLRRIVYLVEGDFRTQDTLQPEALQFAMCKTEAVDGLLVHHTMSIDGSISFLIQLDLQLRDECRRLGPPPPGSAAHHTFGNFSSTGRKNADNSVSLTFAKQLKMIRGLSSERCLAIARVYPTSALLIEAFERCATLAEERALLANLQWGPNKKPLGQAVAATVQAFFRNLSYL